MVVPHHGVVSVTLLDACVCYEERRVLITSLGEIMNHRITVFCTSLVIILCGMFVTPSLHASYTGMLDYSIANIDDIFVPYVNPSLLANRNHRGFGFAQLYADGEFSRQHWLIANMDGTSYLYENSGDVSNHTLASGWEMFPAHKLPNLYGGTSYSWQNNQFGKGGFRSALTYRPHNSTSMAFVWDNPYKSAPAYRAGLALRPLSFFGYRDDYRLELSADMNYRKNAGDYEMEKPVIGIQTQLLDGIKLGGTYNMETEGMMLNFSLNFGKSSLGTNVIKGKDVDPAYVMYASSGELSHKPFLGMTGKNWYKMKLSGDVVTYKTSKYKLGPINIMDSKQKTVEEIINELNQAQNDPSVSGILLVNPSFSASYALQQEILTAMQEFRSTGKKISVYYDNISNGGYIFAAAAADNIYLNPMGVVDLRGLAINSPYFGALLDTLGIDVMNFRSHKYKNAGNMFSETEMTSAEREVYDALLQSMYDQMIAQVHVGRGDKLVKPVETTIDEGPYFVAKDALDGGLVDKLIYEDELHKLLKETEGFSSSINSMQSYREYSWTQPREKLIAVIYASGNIVMGKGTPGKVIAHDTTVKQIRAARKNPDYKGIILRVDSGGGSAQASDIILRELELAQTENKKPVVVSMAGVAASGGYYIACKADRIIADPATLTGSIGVIGLTFNAERLFKKVKVNWSSVKKGENADFGSMYRKWTQDEKDMMTRFIEVTYEDFVRKVDEGRDNLTLDQVHQYAQGRVWTGEQAKEIGLIDDLGGMDVALEHMRELTGIKGNIRLVNATGTVKGFNLSVAGDPLLMVPGMEMLQDINADYGHLYEMWKQFQEGEVLMLAPLADQTVRF